jgi:hypothetical protein
MAAPVGAESYQEALELCLDDIERACLRPLEKGVREFVRGALVQPFSLHHSAWPAHGDTVRRSATYVGRFSELFAAFDNSATVKEEHVKKAFGIIRLECKAKRVRFDWCPTFDA